MELRGYVVVELQNESGHGIDLVAVKAKPAAGGLIIYLEVKSSVAGYPGQLSAAQAATPEFVKNRLERVIAQQGFYKKISPQVVNVAKLLIAEIDAGRPIGGIRADVHWLSKGPRFKVSFKQWKPVIRPRRR